MSIACVCFVVVGQVKTISKVREQFQEQYKEQYHNQQQERSWEDKHSVLGAHTLSCFVKKKLVCLFSVCN